MKMFPVFPALFPACSQSCPTNSLCSQCSELPAKAHVYVVPFLIAKYSITRNTGNIGNSTEKTQVGLSFSWNKTGNTGNTPVDTRSPARTELDLFESSMAAG
jgi:hypothetical protein